VGIVAWECLAGAPPFTGIGVEAALASPDRPLPPPVPAEVAALVAELTARNPAERPASASEAAARAGRLRDVLTGSTAGRPGGWPDSPAAGPAGLPATLPGADSATLAEPPLPDPPRERWRLPRYRMRPARGAALAAAAAVLAGLAGWLLIGMFSAAVPIRREAVRSSATAGAGPASGAARRATVAPVQVSAAALDGLPVSAVRRQLGQLSLRVRVLWRPSSQGPPGTVLSVQPAGQVPAGSIVVVTAALRPPGYDRPNGTGNGDGGGD
jgi:serine/threonine-protein kinase